MLEDDEDYLDDPIKLIDYEQNRFNCFLEDTIIIDDDADCHDNFEDDSVNGHVYHNEVCQKKFDAYISMFKKSTIQLPRPFTKIKRNVDLLNTCRPLIVKVVDCTLYPWYYKSIVHEHTSKDFEDIIMINEILELPELMISQDNNLFYQSKINDEVEKCERELSEIRLLQVQNNLEYLKILYQNKDFIMADDYLALVKQSCKNTWDSINTRINQKYIPDKDKTLSDLQIVEKKQKELFSQSQPNIKLSDELPQIREKNRKFNFDTTKNMNINSNKTIEEKQSESEKKQSDFQKKDILIKNSDTKNDNGNKKQNTIKKDRKDKNEEIKRTNDIIDGRRKTSQPSRHQKLGSQLHLPSIKNTDQKDTSLESTCLKNVFSSNRIIPHFHQYFPNVNELGVNVFDSEDRKFMKDFNKRVDSSRFLFANNQIPEKCFTTPNNFNNDVTNGLFSNFPSQNSNAKVNTDNRRKQRNYDLGLFLEDMSCSSCDNNNKTCHSTRLNNPIHLNECDSLNQQIDHDEGCSFETDFIQLSNQDITKYQESSGMTNVYNNRVISDNATVYADKNCYEYCTVYPRISSVYSLNDYGIASKRLNVNSYSNDSQNLNYNLQYYNYKSPSNSVTPVPNATGMQYSYQNMNPESSCDLMNTNGSSKYVCLPEKTQITSTKKSSTVSKQQNAYGEYLNENHGTEFGAGSSLNGFLLSSVRPAVKTLPIKNYIMRDLLEKKSRLNGFLLSSVRPAVKSLQIRNEHPLIKDLLQKESRLPLLKNRAPTNCLPHYNFNILKQLNTVDSFSTSNGYSAPILPIPTYQKTFEALQNINFVNMHTGVYQETSLKNPKLNQAIKRAAHENIHIPAKKKFLQD